MLRESVQELSDLPVELMASPPRRVRMTSTGWINVFAAVLFASVGAVLLFKADKEVTTQSKLRQRGGESMAQITDKWTQGRSSVPHVSYTFSVDGAVYTGESSVPRKISSGLTRGDSLPILYLPANPNISCPAGWQDSAISVFFGPFMVFGILVLIGGMFVRKLQLQRRLAMEGVAARGSITECSGPNRSGFVLAYNFRSADGEMQSGRSLSDFSKKVDSKICVLYLPKDPSRSEIYPFNVDFFRIEQ